MNFGEHIILGLIFDKHKADLHDNKYNVEKWFHRLLQGNLFRTNFVFRINRTSWLSVWRNRSCFVNFPLLEMRFDGKTETRVIVVHNTPLFTHSSSFLPRDCNFSAKLFEHFSKEITILDEGMMGDERKMEFCERLLLASRFFHWSAHF